MSITGGALVEVTTATGETVRMRALSGPQDGRDFRVVWVVTEDEYARAQEAGETPKGIPWPEPSVQALRTEPV